MRKGQIIFSIFFILILVLSTWFWLSLKTINDFYNPYDYIKTAIILVVNLCLIFILIYLFDDLWAFLSLIILPISYLAVFRPNNIYLIGFSIISFFALCLAFKSAATRKSEVIKVNFLFIVSRAKNFISFSVLILIIGLIYFHTLSLKELVLPKTLFGKAIVGVNPFINNFLPIIDLESSVDNLLARQLISSGEVKFNFSEISTSLKKELGQAGFKSGVLDLSMIKDNKALQDKLESEFIEIVKKKKAKTLSEERQKLSDKFNLSSLVGDEPLKEIIYLAANKFFISLTQNYQRYLPLAAAIITFFIGKGVFGILSLLALIIAKVVLRLFKAFRIIKIEKVSAEREIIVI